MASFIIVIIVIIAALLGLIVLVQNPKGGGLAVGFQGTSQVGGVQRTADFLEKATWYLAIAMFVLCLVSAAWFNTKTTTTDDADSATPTEQTQGGDQPADGAQQPAQ